MMSKVADNLLKVREKIADSAARAGRSANEISLVAVSKTKPIELIHEAFLAGQTIFGENYVQEAVEKAENFSRPEWHIIGSLQTNKVKFLGAHFDLIHSVDRPKLAIEIDKLASRHGRVQDILLQVRIGDEASKQGTDLAKVPELIDSILACPGLRLRGLMSLPPVSDDERVGRGYFASLREGMQAWKSRLPGDLAAHFNALSMGTSGDFEWAILEGATMVRVGTAIFGARESHL